MKFLTQLAGWRIDAEHNGAVRCLAVSETIYVAKNKAQAERLKVGTGIDGEKRQVFSRGELTGKGLSSMSRSEMLLWLRWVLPMKRLLDGRICWVRKGEG